MVTNQRPTQTTDKSPVTGYAPPVPEVSGVGLPTSPELLDESGVGASGTLVVAAGATGATAAALVAAEVLLVVRRFATFFAGALRVATAFFAAFFVAFLALLVAFFAPPFLGAAFTDFLAAFFADFFAATEREPDFAAAFFLAALPPLLPARAVFFLLPFRAAIPSASSF